MQELGFPPRQAGELIQLRERKVEACESVRQLLTAKVADVLAKMRELRRTWRGSWKQSFASAAVN
jgi:hypothetical protein